MTQRAPFFGNRFLHSCVIAICGLAFFLLSPQAPGSSVFRNSGLLTTGRTNHSATVLPDGRVLIAGGMDATGALASAELFDPLTETYAPTGSLATARTRQTATLLPDGRVLVIGSESGNVGNEIYDPASGVWSTASPCLQTRNCPTATLLTNGQVLVTGGKAAPGSEADPYLSSAELYDPNTDTWTSTGSLSTGRQYHTATLLEDGTVLVAGGLTSSTDTLNIAELYDLATGVWTVTGELASQKDYPTATLLPDGSVLILAESFSEIRTIGVTPAEIYHPNTGQWTTLPDFFSHAGFHTATRLPDNTILFCATINRFPPQNAQAGAMIFHPDTGTLSATDAPSIARFGATASLLADGSVLITGGAGQIPGEVAGGGALRQSEIYVSVAHEWQETGEMHEKRHNHSTTVLRDGKVLVAGGVGALPASQGVSGSLATAELYDPTNGTWRSTGAMISARSYHAAVLLRSGKVLVVGDGAEIYDPVTERWSRTGPLPLEGSGCSATLLNDGTVLAAGSGETINACIYDPVKNSWSVTGSLHQYRVSHTATLLRDGKVFVHGGTHNSYSGSYATSSCEIYDPQTRKWTEGPYSQTNRSHHVAALLPSGKVLICGGDYQFEPNGGWVSIGWNDIHLVYRAEIYDPFTGSWSLTEPTTKSHAYAAGITLADGKFLVVGGNNGEIYDEASAVWSSIALLNTPRSRFSGALLNDGRIFVAGGLGPAFSADDTHILSSAELYDFVAPFIELQQPPGSRISVSEAMNFGSDTAGSQTQLKFVLRNAGTANLTGLKLAITGAAAADFKVISNLATTVAAPGKELAFTLSFAPSSVGWKSAILHLSSATYSVDLPLVGNSRAAAPEINVSKQGGKRLINGESQKFFGKAKINHRGRSKIFSIENTGTADLTNLAIRKSGRNRMDFKITPLRKNRLAPGATTTFKLTFKPSAKGTRSATIRIKSNDPEESPFSFQITGLGAKP